jgi:hypothetical protein
VLAAKSPALLAEMKNGELTLSGILAFGGLRPRSGPVLRGQ